MTAFRRILIANRGEIALRIMRACRGMGIETVAVYSDFDRDALHVRQADAAVPIGPAAARDSYLNIPAIISAARRSGADAIHPGYGFLAENADFAASCEEAGIAFIGPPSSVIRVMGSKTEARRIAQEAGVPVVPSATESDLSKLGFPILIKASAGGGGRGMRIVRSAAEFKDALAAARSEAERAFADGTLLIEKYIEGARHVEIQILGDHHGNLMHLFERDCSVQRRHQKIIEESPSPALTPDLRKRMAEAALALGRKVGYTNVGTVEFLLAPSQEFYFIEANTRIQVEHPVTEMITGLNLLRLQIEIAQGHRLPNASPQQNGHAIEARLYAEDPGRGFLPCAGTLHEWDPPAGTGSPASPVLACWGGGMGSPASPVLACWGGGMGSPAGPVLAWGGGMDGLRVDSGVEQGTEVGVYYDPLLAKVIAHAADREAAINKLVYALRHCGAQGVETNREFLVNLLDSKEFRSATIHTGSDIAVYAHEEAPDKRGSQDAVFLAVLRSWIERTEHAQRQVLPSIPVRFRNNPYSGRPMILKIAGPEFNAHTSDVAIEVLGLGEGGITVVADGVQHQFQIRRHADEYYMRSDLGQRTVKRMPRYPHKAGSGQHQTANSPMPGQVLRILASQGQRVKAGDTLIVLEAMKMEQNINATMDGVVAAILVKPGEIVAPGQMLVEIQSLEVTDANEHANRSAANN